MALLIPTPPDRPREYLKVGTVPDQGLKQSYRNSLSQPHSRGAVTEDAATYPPGPRKALGSEALI